MAPSSYDTLGEGPDGHHCICLGDIKLPCPGVALRLSAVIDCSPSKDRHAPITIDFLNSLPPPPTPTPQKHADHRFTVDSDEFLLTSQLQLLLVEAMVAAAGLPLECAPSVKSFLHRSASNATNSFYKAVAVTVEAGSPGSIVVDEYEGEEDNDEVPPGADAGECAICYTEYLVGGAKSVSLPCGHTFHRRCIDRWTSVKRSCPYCRGPVDEEQNVYWDEEEEYEEEEGDYGYGSEHDGGDLSPGEEHSSLLLVPGGGETPSRDAGEEEHRSFEVPGGETPSEDAVLGSWALSLAERFDTWEI